MKNGLLHIGLCALALGSVGILGGCKDSAGGGGETSTSGSSTGSNVSSDGDIKIGLVASLNGANLPWGEDNRRGALMAVKEINDAGGIGGRKISLEIEDSNSKPEEGKSATEKLASVGVIGVIGEVSSSITLQMKEVTVPKGIPLIAVGATSPKVTLDSKGLVYRVCYTDDLQGPVMAKFAYDDLGLRKVAVMTDIQQAYSQGLSAAFIKSFEKLGGTIVTEQSYETGQNQFTSQITAMQGLSPQGVFISGYFSEVGPMARQIRAAGMKDIPLFGGDGWDSSDLVSAGGDAIVGGYLCNHYNNNEDRPAVKEFLKKWAAEYDGKTPGTTMGALGYDATKLMIDALKRLHDAGKDLTSANLAEEIGNTVDFDGVSGMITLKGQNGDPLKKALIVQLQADGSQKPVRAYDATEVLN